MQPSPPLEADVAVCVGLCRSVLTCRRLPSSPPALPPSGPSDPIHRLRPLPLELPANEDHLLASPHLQFGSWIDSWTELGSKPTGHGGRQYAPTASRPILVHLRDKDTARTLVASMRLRCRRTRWRSQTRLLRQHLLLPHCCLPHHHAECKASSSCLRLSFHSESELRCKLFFLL